MIWWIIFWIWIIVAIGLSLTITYHLVMDFVIPILDPNMRNFAEPLPPPGHIAEVYLACIIWPLTAVLLVFMYLIISNYFRKQVKRVEKKHDKSG